MDEMRSVFVVLSEGKLCRAETLFTHPGGDGHRGVWNFQEPAERWAEILRAKYPDESFEVVEVGPAEKWTRIRELEAKGYKNYMIDT
jgi:hypothetical protein